MNERRNKYHNIVVLGGSESGTGAALLAAKHGLKVFVSDQGSIKPKYKELLISKGIAFEENGHSSSLIAKADLVIKSPGIPREAPVLGQTKNAVVISEIEFASWFTDAFIIAITGSNGKTTTTLLTGHLLRNAGIDVCVAGNTGNSFAVELASRDYTHFVLEISSFQLDDILDFRPDIAVITNITPDHLDRYAHSFDAYAASKMRLVRNQKVTDTFIFCADDETIVQHIKQKQPVSRLIPFSLDKTKSPNGGFIDQNILHLNLYPNPFTMTIEELALQGRHNTYNSLAAGLSGKILGIRNETLKQSLADYQNIEHRLEYVANVHGVSYYNDSKATNVNSTWYALESFNRPIVWIAGGVDKGNDYSKLVPLVRQKVKAIVCLGKDNQKIIDAFGPYVNEIIQTYSAEQAVVAASFLATNKDVVLLSPACASFDLFENFEDRGNQFKQAVKSL